MPREKSVHIRSAFACEASELSALAMQSKAHWGYCAADLEAWRDDLCIATADIASSHVYVAADDDVVQGFFTTLGQSRYCCRPGGSGTTTNADPHPILSAIVASGCYIFNSYLGIFHEGYRHFLL